MFSDQYISQIGNTIVDSPIPGTGPAHLNGFSAHTCSTGLFVAGIPGSRNKYGGKGWSNIKYYYGGTSGGCEYIGTHLLSGTVTIVVGKNGGMPKLPYWSKITGLNYNEVKIRDAISRYGSCMPSKRNLYFSSRLIMLPEDKVDAIIVHELCHLVYKNHNKEFYNLVKQYIPNYAEIDKWLKKHGKIILF